MQVERGEELRRRGMGKKDWVVGGWRIFSWGVRNCIGVRREERYVGRKLMKKNWSQLREVMRGVTEWRCEGNARWRGTNL